MPTSARMMVVGQYLILVIPVSTPSLALLRLTSKCLVRAKLPPLVPIRMVDVLSCRISMGWGVKPKPIIMPRNHSASVVASHNTIHSDSVEDSVTIFNLNDRAYMTPVPMRRTIHPWPLPST